MKKTLKELTAGDTLYKCVINSCDYVKITVRGVYENELQYGHGYDEKIERSKEYSKKVRDTFILFTNEVDAIRYSKAQMMKVLFEKIEEAKKAIKNIKDFRLKNFELLNHSWTDKQINLLERELNQ